MQSISWILRASHPKAQAWRSRQRWSTNWNQRCIHTWRRPGGCGCASYSTQRLREPVSDCIMWNKANATAAVYGVIRPAPIPKAFTPKATSKRNERGTYFCESRASWFALPALFEGAMARLLPVYLQRKKQPPLRARNLRGSAVILTAWVCRKF